MSDKAKLIATRQSEKIKAKLPIWTLIYNAYKGGSSFINEENLQQLVIEENSKYKKRLSRADYTNHTQQLIDVLVGFVFSNAVKREIEPKYSYINDSIYKGKSLQSLMNMVASNCLKSTVGILVDSPMLDITTEKERIDNGLSPYVVYYTPEQICDFETNDKGELEWIILDNSYLDKSNPFEEPTMKIIKRLWTKDFYQDVETIKKANKEIEYVLGEEITHTLGLIPFIFVNCRDNDSDNICDSPFEDIVLKSRTIFNYNSWANETLGASSFQILTFPYLDQNDLNEIQGLFDVSKGGASDINVYPYKAGTSAPAFIKPDNSVEDHIKMINQMSEEILNKFGMKQETKGSWESGVAKSIDFSKTEAFLKSLSLQLQECERKIIQYCSMYEQKEIDVIIEYPFTYEKSDIEKELLRLNNAFTIPSTLVQNKAYKEIANILFPDMEQKEIDAISNDIDSTNKESISYESGTSIPLN